MLFLFLPLILFKLAGMFFAYQAHLPDRFPPETMMAKLSYLLYQYIPRLFSFVNQNLKIFPSQLVPLMEKTSVKILFLKFPWILIDLAILFFVFILLCSKRKRNFWFILFFLNLNFWVFFYFSVQRFSFTEKLYFFIFKPYKLSSLDARVIACALGIVIVSLFLVIVKKMGTFWFKNQLTILRRKISLVKTICVLLIFGTVLLVKLSGVFLHFDSFDKVYWKGYWISPKGDIEKENLYFTFEKKFNLLFKPSQAVVTSFCQGDYRLFINGTFVGQGGLISGDGVTYYDYWQVNQYLKRGNNKVLIECYNPYLDTLSLVKKKSGMIFQLEAQWGWFKKMVVSDGTWKAAIDTHYQEKTEFASKTTGFQEFFDETVKSPLLEKVLVVDPPPVAPWKELIARPIPYLEKNLVVPLKIMTIGQFVKNPQFDSPDLAVVLGNGFKRGTGEQKLKELPVKIEKKDTFLVFDFGKIVVGYPKVTFFGKGGTVNFGFAEILKKDGSPDIAKMVSQADQVRFGPGEFSYLWRQRRAFRYAMVVFDSKDPMEFKDFVVETINYPADESESYFDSSDPLLNKIFTVSKYTAKIARQGNFEDCPHREKAQYIGDVRIVSLVNYYNYSDKELIKKALWEFALSQLDDGFVRAVYPAGKKLLIPDYSAQWVSAVWEYYLYSGDLDFLEKIYPFLRKQINGFIDYSDNDSLVINQPNWWIFIDQGDQELNVGKSVSLNLFYLEAIISAQKTAEKLNDFTYVTKLKIIADKLKASILEKSWKEDLLMFDDCVSCNHFSRQTNYLALLNGLVPENEVSKFVSKMDLSERLPVVITPYFNTFIAEALFKYGLENKGLELVRSYWEGMLKKGATTFWETYDPKTGRENAAFGESLSHGWSSGPAYLLPKWILGVEPLEPGYSSFRVKPIFADLNFAKGKIPIDRGKSIEVSWNKGSELEMKLKYNFSAKAEVFLPLHEGKKIFLNNNERKDLQYEGTFVKFWIEEPGEYEIVLR